MNLAVLALFRRALTVKARAWMPYIGRGIIALAMFLTVISIRLESDNTYSSMEAPGLVFFGGIVTINVIFILLAALALFATSVTEEKEDGTMGLLRMTRLSSLAIVLGKSGSRVIEALLLLAVQLPFTILSVTLGGVAAEQIWASYITLAAYLLLISGVSTLFSVLLPSSRLSIGVMVGVVILSFLLPLFDQFMTFLATQFWGAGIFATVTSIAAWPFHQVSIVNRLTSVFTIGFQGELWSSEVLAMAGTGVAAFIFSWLAFDPCINNAAPGGAKRPLFVFARSGRRRRRAWGISPMAWKEFQFISGGWFRMFLKSLAYGSFILVVSLFILAVGGGGSELDGLGVFFFIFYLFIIGIELALMAGRLVRNEVNEKTLTSLAMLPRSLVAMTLEKAFGASLSLAPAVCASSFGFFLLLVSASGYELERFFDDMLAVEAFAFYFGAIFFIFLTGFVSLWASRAAFIIAAVVQATIYFLITFALILLHELLDIYMRDSDFAGTFIFFNIVLMMGGSIFAALRLRQLVAEG